MKKVIYLCGRCKVEFDGYLEQKPKSCPECGFDKILYQSSTPKIFKKESSKSKVGI